MTHPFETSTRTIDAYKESVNANMRADEHAEWIRETVAITTEGFIVRRRHNNGFYLAELNENGLRTILNFTIAIETETVSTKGDTRTTTINIRKYKIMDLITDISMRPDMKFYDGMELFTSDPHKLSRYVPPIYPEIDTAWAKRWLEFLRSLVSNQRAFDEEISSHAFRLRYPETFIEKCFVHYSKKGNTGKTTLAWTLSLLYPKLSNPAVNHKQLTETINGWTTDYMMIHVEELQGNEYADKSFAQWIKQATVRSASIRKMHQDTVAGQNNAIIGLNTNQTDLYGLATTSDGAVQERLVILDFKDTGMDDVKWMAKYTEYGLNNTHPKFSAQVEKFAASLYHYLRYEYQIVEGFNPNRYYQPDKAAILKRLCEESGNLPTMFVNILGTREDELYDNYEAPYDVFYLMRDNRSNNNEPKKVIIKLKELKSAWKKFLDEMGRDTTTYTLDKSVFPLLKNIGFEYGRKEYGMGFEISDYAKFNGWLSSRTS